LVFFYGITENVPKTTRQAAEKSLLEKLEKMVTAVGHAGENQGDKWGLT